MNEISARQFYLFVAPVSLIGGFLLGAYGYPALVQWVVESLS